MFSSAPACVMTKPVIPYTYVPPQVNPKYLHSNFKLLPDPTLARLEDKYLFHFNRYSKNDLGMDFDIYYGKKDPYAIFNIDGHPYVFAKGRDKTRLELAQNMENAQWKVMKTEVLDTKFNKDCFLKECTILNKVGKADEPQGFINGAEGSILMNLETGKDLYEWMLQRKPEITDADELSSDKWPDLIWLDMALELAEIIKKMHDNNVFHGDIKLENFLYDLARQKVSDIDFGFAKECQTDKNGKKFAYDTLAGVPLYTAPELKNQSDSENGMCTYTEASEVFALGVVFKHILLNHVIYLDIKDGNKKKEALLSRSRTKTLFEQDVDLGMVRFLTMMTHETPSRRPTVTQIIERLTAIREIFIKKYPQQLIRANEIYTKATAVETERLKKIAEEVQKRTETPESIEEFSTVKPVKEEIVSKVVVKTKEDDDGHLHELTNKRHELNIFQLKELLRQENDEKNIISKLNEMKESGFRLTSQDPNDIFVLILTAAVRGFKEILYYFKDNNIDLNLEVAGTTPVITAVQIGDCDAVSVLAECGVDVNKPSSTKTTAGSVAFNALRHAKSKNEDDESETDYVAILDVLYEACQQKSIDEFQQQSKLPFFSQIPLEAILEKNTRNAGLEEYKSRYRLDLGNQCQYI